MPRGGGGDTEDNGDSNVIFPVARNTSNFPPGILSSKRKAVPTELNTDIGDCLGIVPMPLRKKTRTLDQEGLSKEGSSWATTKETVPLQMPNASIPVAHEREEETFLSGMRSLRGDNNPMDVSPLQINSLPSIFMEHQSSHSVLLLSDDANERFLFDNIGNKTNTVRDTLTVEPIPKVTDDDYKERFGSMSYAISNNNRFVTNDINGNPAAFTFDPLLEIMDEEYSSEFVSPASAGRGLGFLTSETPIELMEEDHEETFGKLTVEL